MSQHVWRDLPDGLTDLADHNLVSYKSMRESLTKPSTWELVSYGVAYAKQQWRKGWAASAQDPSKLRLIAVATLRPAWLIPDEGPTLREVAQGVYEIDVLDLVIRIKGFETSLRAGTMPRPGSEARDLRACETVRREE
ncbi:MAG: hypothetical protein HUU20_16705 [Pirellulales bacterium]|nr:hypothetical protein [Pirellulales bacterium]